MSTLPQIPNWEFDRTAPLLAPHMNQVFAAFRDRHPQGYVEELDRVDN